MSLSFSQATKALSACIKARTTSLVQGPPGVGKTALVRAAAKGSNLPCHDLIASNCDATDIAGLPYVHEGVLKRALLPEIKACVEKPGILFLDELTAVPPSVQAPLMRLLLEKVAGGVKLHPESVVLAACNPPEHVAGGVELSAATINRVIKLVDYAPTFDEIRGFFDGLGEPGSDLNNEARDLSATMAIETGLITLNPPRASIDAGAPFNSPRAWELGIRTFAAHGTEDEVGYQLLAGAVGDTAAAAYLGIRKLRQHLPSVEEITVNPQGAKVPDQKDRQIAALGVLSRVSDKDTWAAWTYADRLQPEIAAACARVLMTRTPQGGSKHKQIGVQAQVKLLAKVKRNRD
jgi:ATPase family associated with various cellular activities (AAA)